MKNPLWKRLINFFGPAIAISVGALGLAASALAQSQGGGVTVDQINSAVTSTDAASGFFRALLGDFWDHPLTTIGGASGLLGSMFLIYNGAIFALGVMWASYGVLGSVAETANTGEALGKRMSAVWMPIRMVTGIAGIVPVFGGFSLSQVVIVMLSALGIGMANMMNNAAIDAADTMNVSMNSVGAVGVGSLDIQKVSHDMFEMFACEAAHKKAELEGLQNLSPSLNLTEREETDDAAAGIVYRLSIGVAANKTACGTVTVRQSYKDGSSVLGFRSSAVSYVAYADRVRSVAVDVTKSTFRGVSAQMSQLAQAWYASRATENPLPYPQAEIERIGNEGSAAMSRGISEAVAAAVGDAANGLKPEIKAKMRAEGFAALGAYYSTYAEAGSALTAAAGSLNLQSTGALAVASMGNQGSSFAELKRAIDQARRESAAAAEATEERTDDQALSGLCKIFSAQWATTPTGSCSLGQSLVKGAIYGASYGSGGGGIGSGVVNPIIMFKNMGDYVLTIGGALMTANVVSSFIAPSKDDNFLESGVKAAAGKTVLGALAGLVQKIAWTVPYIIILGLLMSVYLPMIPFITWMGGLIQYTVVVCQGIVGAPLGLFAHLDTEGEGMGRRTEAFYMFALNVLFRPALMTFGFFLASALMVVIGSFQVQLFLTAMSNAQGNSLTGLFSLLGYLAIFFVLNVTLIQGLFNMIFLLPDQVLGLVGSMGAHADLGKEAEGKVHTMFMAMGRSTQSAAMSMGGKLPKSKAAAASDAAGARDSLGASATGKK